MPITKCIECGDVWPSGPSDARFVVCPACATKFRLADEAYDNEGDEQ